MDIQKLNHLAIIPDGNRRWAKSRGLASSLGHFNAVNRNNLQEIFEVINSEKIKYLSFWAFSTENWKREKSEVDYIFNLLFEFENKLKKLFEKYDVKFKRIGRIDRLPSNVLDLLYKLEEQTKNNKGFEFLFLIDYGGRDEIVRAVNKIVFSGEKNIDELEFSKFLDFNEIPEPDLIIRTGGEKRLSGLMCFQSAYSEICFSDVFFPDFGCKELLFCIEEYYLRKRNFGS